MSSMSEIMAGLSVLGSAQAKAAAMPVQKCDLPAKSEKVRKPIKRGKLKHSVAEKRHMARVRAAGCVVCNRFKATGLPVEIHHVAEESGLRSGFAVAGLCGSPTDGGHHRGAAGLHGLGTKAFLRMYRPPGESEFGLLVWAIEDMAR